ncbi:MAG: hemin uptake protein HemP [Dokdonella sp.]
MFQPMHSAPAVSHDSVPASSDAGHQRSFSARRIESNRLMSGARELVIEHAGQEYRLRVTRNDKLILTK